MSPILSTKLHQPAIPPRQVHRPQLIQRLQAGLVAGRPLTLVSAPAGFGKTTCIRAWLDHVERPVAWLSLDAGDDDPIRFFTYFVAALQGVDESLNSELRDTLHGGGQLPPVETIATRIINDIVALNLPFLLVLDDFHAIQESFILDVLELMLANPPPLLHLILITREDPALPLARLRGAGQMTEIRAADLRFDYQEAGSFMHDVMGLSLSPADIAALGDKTEGWIVGLQLAGLSVRDREDPSGFIANLTGSHRFILSYLTEQVLDRQPEDVRQFLLRTSILDRLNGDLCNTVAGRQDSHSLLERLLQANLFVIPLDDEGRWYRYHHLFADLLVNRLQQTMSTEAIEGLHRQASNWLARNGLLHEAIDHAQAGQDYDAAASLVEREIRAMMYAGRVSTLQKWLAGFPDESFRMHPRLRIHQIWIDLLQGKSDLSEEALQEKEDTLNALPPSPENDRLRAELAMILSRFVAFSGNTTRAIRLAEESLDTLPAEDVASLARAHSTLAIAYGLEGRPEQARRAFDNCLRLTQAAGNYSLAANAAVIMARQQADYGQLRQAARTYQTIIDMGVQAKQKVFYPACQGHIGLAGIHLEWNDLDTAREHLEHGMALCRQGGQPGMYTAQTIESRLHQAEGHFEAASREFSLLGESPQGVDPAGVTRQIQFWLAAGDVHEASRLARPWIQMLDEPSEKRPPLLALEIVETIVARILLARGKIANAMQLLDHVQASAEPALRHGRMIEVYLLRALALQVQSREDIPSAALESLARALDLAEPEGYVMLFLEEGPALIPLLRAFLTQQQIPDRLKAYARRLLSAFASYGKPTPAPAAQPVEVAGLVETLSPRELEVLELIAAGDSNRAIADKLVITVSAVKKHTGNIYGKLGVNRRTQAVARARQLGILSAKD